MTRTRRDFLATAGAGLAAAGLGLRSGPAEAREAPRGDRPPRAEGVAVLNPRTRVPLSFLVDDSTCLVNLAHFCIPQFAHVWPDRYKQDWRQLPREIPDSFVRKFGQWCYSKGVKGKYSEIARYWAAGELTRIDREANRYTLRAPFGSPDFTVRVPAPAGAVPKVAAGDRSVALQEVPSLLTLSQSTWTRTAEGIVVCFDLPKGTSRIDVG